MLTTPSPFRSRNVIDGDDLLEAFRSQLQISQTDASVIEEIIVHAYKIDEQERTSQNFSLESVWAAISAVPSLSQPRIATSHQKRHCKILGHGILECLKNEQKSEESSSPDSSPQSIALRSKVGTFFFVRRNKVLPPSKRSVLEDKQVIGEISRLSELITVFEASTTIDDQTAVYEDAIVDMNKVLGRVRDAVGELKYAVFFVTIFWPRKKLGIPKKCACGPADTRQQWHSTLTCRC